MVNLFETFASQHFEFSLNFPLVLHLPCEFFYLFNIFEQNQIIVY